jgi:hypothetical protein
MALIGRIFVILFALWLATMAAGLVWSIGLLGVQWQASGDVGERVVFWGAAFLASGITASLIFLPTLVAVVLAEAFSIRSLLIYAAGGAALTFLAYQGVGLGRTDEESIDTPPPAVTRELEIAAAAGAAFGLVYWAIAGRKAGAWRARM